MDENNACTRVVTPSWCWAWFAVPPVYAADVWSILSEELRIALAFTDLVYPCYMRLAMGCSHSVAIIMNMNTTKVRRTLVAAAKLMGTVASLQALEGVGGNLMKDENCENVEHWTDGQWIQRHKISRPLEIADTATTSLDDWVRAVHAARRSRKQVFTFMHLFAGPDRDDDVLHWIYKLTAEANTAVIGISVDLVGGCHFDLEDPLTVATLSSLFRGSYIDGLLG